MVHADQASQVKVFPYTPQGTKRDPVTFQVQDGELASVEEIDGVLHKKGIRVPPFLVEKALTTNENCGFPYTQRCQLL
jgi:hypothetical protein